MLRGTIYPAGSTVLLDDIGTAGGNGPTRPGGTLVCITNNINPQCCRTSDGGNVGEWFFPNGTMVPRNGNNPENFVFTRSGSTRQVRLNQRFPSHLEPVGEYECRVPDSNGVEHVANISVILSKLLHAGVYFIFWGEGSSSSLPI